MKAAETLNAPGHLQGSNIGSKHVMMMHTLGCALALRQAFQALDQLKQTVTFCVLEPSQYPQGLPQHQRPVWVRNISLGLHTQRHESVPRRVARLQHKSSTQVAKRGHALVKF